MTERDIKLLWGRSGNRCAICRTELSQDKKLSSEKYPLGEQAHIVGEKESAPRGKSNLNEGERDGYSNRILLCPTHHTEIDRDDTYYSVERLYHIRQQHELWVQESLAERTDGHRQAQDLIYSTLIDTAAWACDFEHWSIWTSWAVGPRPHWNSDAYGKIRIFRDSILRAAWPRKNKELERALQTLAFSIFEAADFFWLHAETEGNIAKTIPFYRLKDHAEELKYRGLVNAYREWELLCAESVMEATKAANWVSHVVRRDINPLFYAKAGKFLVTRGPFSDMTYRSYVPEFTSREKKSLPKAFFVKSSKARQKYEKMERKAWAID